MSADINRLKNILAKSKAVMKKTDQEYGSPTGNNTQSATPTSPVMEYDEKDMPNLTEQFINKYGMTDGKIPASSKYVSPKNGNYPNIEKSKMPKAVLDAMVNNPIEIPENPFSVGSFDLNDVPELVEAPKQSLSENIQQPTGSMDREQIRQVVREEFEDMVRDILDEYMEKSLVTEDIHIKIGNTVFGGSLKPIPKKQKRK